MKPKLELERRYKAAMHRMQSATALDFAKTYDGFPDELVRALKHLRVGINSSMADHGALVRLLIAKGLVTEEEYYEALVVAAEREADERVAEVKEKWGLPDGVQFG